MRHPDRKTVENSALHTGVVLALCLAVWLLLDSHNLYAAAKASPLGARRTAAMDVLSPVRLVSEYTGLATLDNLFDQSLSRNPSKAPVGLSSVREVVGGVQSRRTGSLAELKSAAGDGAGIGELVGPNQWWDMPSGQAPQPPAFVNRRPSQANPLKVLIVGDSIGEDMGQQLSNDLAESGSNKVLLDGRPSTGLSRPDYFDWPSQLGSDLSTLHPQLTVVMMGGNDYQSFSDAHGVQRVGSQSWTSAYGQRVASFMREATSAGSRVIWVGMPPMRDQGLDDGMRALDDIFQNEASSVSGVYYVSSWGVLDGPDGGYTDYGTSQSGSQQLWRTPDGIHLTIDGGQQVANEVLLAMNTDLGIVEP